MNSNYALFSAPESKELENLKKLINAEYDRLSSKSKIVDESLHVQTDDLMDLMDLCISDRDRETQMLLRSREALFKQKLEDALRRIKNGRYGRCESCDGPIAVGRLRARPTTTLCIECKEADESVYKPPRHIGHSEGLLLQFKSDDPEENKSEEDYA